jgi:hypothetical protein
MEQKRAQGDQPGDPRADRPSPYYTPNGSCFLHDKAHAIPRVFMTFIHLCTNLKRSINMPHETHEKAELGFCKYI